MKIGINLEYIRSDDKPFEYGAREAAKIGYKYVEPLLSTGYDMMAEGGFYHILSMEEDPLEVKDLCDSLVVGFESVLETRMVRGDWTDEELRTISMLEEQRYSDLNWRKSSSTRMIHETS